MSPCFFTGAPQNGLAFLEPEDLRHAARALRLSPGDFLTVAAQGRRWRAVLEKGEPLRARLLQELPSTEPRVRLTLYQGLPKGDRMDYVVQKCAEAGVRAVVPCLLRRCVAEPGQDGLTRRLTRWRRIGREASMQAFRTEPLQVLDPIGMEELVRRLPRHALSLVPWEEERALSLPAALGGEEDIALVIGPEGGIDPEEIARLPARPVSLGPRIFRTETAGLAAAVAVFALAGDLEPARD